jgi:hypothetical protein
MEKTRFLNFSSRYNRIFQEAGSLQNFPGAAGSQQEYRHKDWA